MQQQQQQQQQRQQAAATTTCNMSRQAVLEQVVLGIVFWLWTWPTASVEASMERRNFAAVEGGDVGGDSARCRCCCCCCACEVFRCEKAGVCSIRRLTTARSRRVAPSFCSSRRDRSSLLSAACIAKNKNNTKNFRYTNKYIFDICERYQLLNRTNKPIYICKKKNKNKKETKVNKNKQT